MSANLPTPLLDATAMGDLLQRELPGYAAWQVRECGIHQTRRRISRKTERDGAPHLGIAYRLALRHRASGEGITQWLYAKAYSRGASQAAFTAACDRALVMPVVGLPLALLAARDLLVWTVPNDPMLPQLPAFLDGRALNRQMRHDAQCAMPLCDRPIEAARIVRYEPESHCTARFDWRTPERERFGCYGKTYADERGQAVDRRIRVLYSACVADQDAFAIARPLGCSAASKTVWQEAVDGVPLRAALEGPYGDQWIVRVARALARLHALPCSGDRSISSDALLERACKQRDKLVRADATLAALLDPPLDRLMREVPSQETQVPIHGDFHVDQMACTNDRVVLFDFDNFAEGSAAHDVADFVSQFLTDATVPYAARRALALRFMRAYIDSAAVPPSVFEMEWYLRLLLLRKAYSFFVRNHIDWQQRVRRATSLAASFASLSAPLSAAARLERVLDLDRKARA